MKTVAKINLSMVVVAILALFPLSLGYAAEATDYNYDSIYMYNALQNQASILDLLTTARNSSPSDFIEEPNIEVETEDLRLAGESESINVNTDTEQESVNIAEELKKVIEKQKISTDNVDTAIKNISELKTFVIGNDLGILKFELVQLEGQASLLKALAKKTQNNTEKVAINNDLDLLKKEQAKVEDFILEQKNKFSLLGWFTTFI